MAAKSYQTDKSVVPTGESSHTPYALAWLRSSIEGRASLSSTEGTKTFSCSTLVALTIGAVMLGRAKSHARDTLAGVALYFFATMSSASRILKPRSLMYFFSIRARGLFSTSLSDRYLPERNPLAKGK